MGARILFLMSDTGGGHRSVADAIATALGHLFPGRYDCQLADIMADGFRWPLSHAGRMYGSVVNSIPRLWGLFWHLTNGRRRAPFTLRMVSPLSGARLRSLLVKSRPDLIVSTHPWANYIPLWALEELGWQIPVATMVTDPVSIHHWWLCPHIDLCLVATQKVGEKAIQAGLSPDRVLVVGIPVHANFLSAVGDRCELRRSLGMVPDLFTVLLVSGGDGAGRVLAIARAVAEASLDVQLLVVAGRNERLRKSLQAFSWQVPTRVMGFAHDMSGLMRAADLLITKAGPSTISEALASGLPMLITGSLPGQEEGNEAWVVQTGAALLTPTPEQVVCALKQLLRADSETLAQMADHGRQAAQPHAASTVAKVIDDLLRRRRTTPQWLRSEKGVPSP